MNIAVDRSAVRPQSHPLFLECDTGGKVLWMNRGAREQFGSARNVFDWLPAKNVAQARRLLAGEEPVMEICAESLRRPEGKLLLPVCFSRVLYYDHRVWLSARVGESVSEVEQHAAGGLRDIHERVLGHYFRLQKVQEKLKAAGMRRRGERQTALRLLEEERARLGRELHAGVGQALAGIRVHLEIVNTQLTAPPQAARNSLERIGTLAESALQQVRSVARRLHPPEWERLSLYDALSQLWDVSGIPQGYEAQLELAELPQEPPHAGKVLIYRMAQEAFSNLIRHAAATRVSLTVAFTDGRFVCRVQDNGRGFDSQKATAAGVGSGIGLRSIREQATLLGGGFSVASGAEGTTLTLWLPAAMRED